MRSDDEAMRRAFEYLRASRNGGQRRRPPDYGMGCQGFAERGGRSSRPLTDQEWAKIKRGNIDD